MSRASILPTSVLCVMLMGQGVLVEGCASLTGSGLPALAFEDPGRQEWLRKLEAQTRSESLVIQLDTRLMLTASLLTPSLLEAEALEQARVYRLPAEQVRVKTELARQQASQSQQVLLWVAAKEPRLAQLENGLWRVTLLDSAGTQVEPTKVEFIRTPDAALVSFYPQLDSLGLTYRLSFPPVAPSGKAWSDEPTVMLQVVGTQGAIRVAWGR